MITSLRSTGIVKPFPSIVPYAVRRNASLQSKKASFVCIETAAAPAPAKEGQSTCGTASALSTPTLGLLRLNSAIKP